MPHADEVLGLVPSGPESGEVAQSGCPSAAVPAVRDQPCRAAELVTHGRLDAVGVIGAALEAMVGPPGHGTRNVAQRAGLPHTTVRDWRRRFVSRAEVLASGANRAVVALGGVVPRLAGTPGAVVIGALRAAWREALRCSRGAVASLWRFANGLLGSHLLSTNINPPWSTS